MMMLVNAGGPPVNVLHRNGLGMKGIYGGGVGCNSTSCRSTNTDRVVCGLGGRMETRIETLLMTTEGGCVGETGAQ